MDCLFCKIIKGDIPSKTVYEDDLVKVFLDINPSTNGDMLVVPKKHFENIYDIDDNLLLHIHNMLLIYILHLFLHYQALCNHVYLKIL